MVVGFVNCRFRKTGKKTLDSNISWQIKLFPTSSVLFRLNCITGAVIQGKHNYWKRLQGWHLWEGGKEGLVG